MNWLVAVAIALQLRVNTLRPGTGTSGVADPCGSAGVSLT